MGRPMLPKTFSEAMQEIPAEITVTFFRQTKPSVFTAATPMQTLLDALVQASILIFMMLLDAGVARERPACCDLLDETARARENVLRVTGGKRN